MPRPVFNFQKVGAAATLSGPLCLDALLFCEFRESLNAVANFCTSQAQFIKLLKIEPKFRAGSEPMSEPQRGIGRYRSLAVNDTRDSIYRDVDLPRQFSGGNSKLLLGIIRRGRGVWVRMPPFSSINSSGRRSIRASALSIKLASFCRRLAVVYFSPRLLCRFDLAVRAISIRRRNASERQGLSFCCLARPGSSSGAALVTTPRGHRRSRRRGSTGQRLQWLRAPPIDQIGFVL
jgi:hypothetical protein